MFTNLIDKCIHQLIKSDYPIQQIAASTHMNLPTLIKLKSGKMAISQLSLQDCHTLETFYLKNGFHPRNSTVTAIKHVLHAPYHYALNRNHNIIQHRRIQPENHMLGYNAFSITMPFTIDHQKHHMTLELVKRCHTWILLTDVAPSVISNELHLYNQLNDQQSKEYKDWVLQQCRMHQLLPYSSSIYYLIIENYNLQNACYRLTQFNLERQTILGYMANAD